MELNIKQETPNAIIPTRGTSGSAGLDLYSIENKRVPSRGQALVSTGISVSYNVYDSTNKEYFYMQIFSRSGLASKYNIHVGSGVIDMDYRGVIHVLLLNHSDTDYTVKEGDKIAQMIILPYIVPETINIVTSHEEEKNNERKTNGFGSTGNHFNTF